MNRRVGFLGVLYCGVYAVVNEHHASATTSPPTIIQIVGDDCGYNDFGFQNRYRTYTPNIDALVKDGLRLNTYVSN